MSDVLAPPPPVDVLPPPAPAPAAESAKPPEIVKPEIVEKELPKADRRINEATLLGETSVDRQISLAKNDTVVAESSPHASILAALKDGSPKKINSTEGQAFRGQLRGLVLTREDGTKFVVETMETAEDGSFVLDNGTKPERFSKDAVITAYLKQNENAIVGELPPAQQAAAELQFKIKDMQAQGKTEAEISAFIDGQGDSVDAAILSSAKDMGVLTEAQFRKFILKTTGADQPNADTEAITRANGHLEKINGTNLVNPDEFKTIIMDYIPEQLMVERSTVEDTIKTYEAELANPHLSPETKKHHENKLTEAQAKLNVIDQLQYAGAKDGNPLGDMLENLGSGIITPEKSKMFQDAIDSGDTEMMLEAVFKMDDAVTKNMSDAEKAKHKAKRREMSKTIAKYGAGGAAVALFLLLSAMSKGAGQ